MIELRAFAFIDQLQKQLVGYIGSTARGYYPVAGQSALFMEIAPGIQVNALTDVVLKKAKTTGPSRQGSVTGSPLAASGSSSEGARSPVASIVVRLFVSKGPADLG